MSRAFFRRSGCHRSDCTGFTLIELMVIVAILGVLALIAIPVYFSYVDKAKVTLAVSSLVSLRGAMERFHVDNAEYPTPPVDFMGTGLDAAGRVVADPFLLDQLKQDLFSVDSYVLVDNNWTIMAKAKDKKNTVITLTQQMVTH